VRLSVTDEPFAAARLRAAVENVAEENGLSGSATFELKLAATEALANALTHGAPPVNVTLECRDDAVEIEISDCGEFLPNARPNADGGRGIPLMIALVDELAIGHDRAGTRLLLRKRVDAGCAQSLSA